MNAFELLKTVWPLIVIQLIFQLYALYDMVVTKKRKTKNLNPLLWGFIIVIGELFGAALYFLIGRSEE